MRIKERFNALPIWKQLVYMVLLVVGLYGTAAWYDEHQQAYRREEMHRYNTEQAYKHAERAMRNIHDSGSRPSRNFADHDGDQPTTHRP